MTNIEILKRFVKRFGGNIPDFSNDDYWMNLSNGTDWIKKRMPNDDFTILAEKYQRALFEIATIEHEINNNNGVHINEVKEV